MSVTRAKLSIETPLLVLVSIGSKVTGNRPQSVTQPPLTIGQNWCSGIKRCTQWVTQPPQATRQNGCSGIRRGQWTRMSVHLHLSASAGPMLGGARQAGGRSDALHSAAVPVTVGVANGTGIGVQNLRNGS